MEKSQLNQLKEKTCESVSTLCQRVCTEANLQPEQLQVLAKYTTTDCPLSSFFPYIDTLLSQPGLPLQLRASFSACSVDLDKYMVGEEASSSSRSDTITEDDQHSLQMHTQHTHFNFVRNSQDCRARGCHDVKLVIKPKVCIIPFIILYLRTLPQTVV